MGVSRGRGGLSDSAAATLARLLGARGLSEDEIDRGLGFVMTTGVKTMREAYELAVSRVRYSDEELAAGMRFRAENEAG